MPLSEKRKASNKRWDEKNLVRLSLALPVALHVTMKSHTEKTGETINGFIRRSIKETIENDTKKEEK